ncbi:FKBP-type peptidyl-prolyl cis-trans isomerase [Maribacter halichondriae]|uniref:FKBP-type peptidyl-prolyl cis-trans isomerase n=1 Tax=Maribacter halichondriae TaxID=2980554 RepID=UPI002359443B|nr:FKBP-type peptidyl-prolyl cis-trans isomerase [Maribacter sp. Hal144]
MRMNRMFFLMLMIGVAWSCKKDDGPEIELVPPRLLAEVVVENDAEIKAYLQTHFYNYEEFENPPADFDFKIKIDTIAGENADKRPLLEETKLAQRTVNVSSGHFSLNTNEEDIQHTYYYLTVREGTGEQLTVADSTYVRYEGSLLNGQVFDGSIFTPVWFDLARIQAPQQGARGFSEGTSHFKAGGEVTVNDDGTFTVDGYGIGLIIMPSGLGFYSTSQSTIPAYSPLIFKVDVFAVNKTDHDQDGIPSIQEDLNGDGYLYNDDTDQAFEDANGLQRVVDFLDSDDDGDGEATSEEILIDGEIKTDENGIVIFPDSDGDGNPDHRDDDS